MRLRLREPVLYRWLRLKRALDKRPRPSSELGTPAIRRILAISCTALGDTLLSTPALAALRQTYPQAHFTLLVHPSLLALFTGLDSVDELIPYDGKWRGFGGVARQLKDFDLAVILHGNEPQATPLAYFSGARHIFKLPNNNRWNFLLNNRTPVVSWDDLGHGIDQRLAVARLAGAREPFSRRMTVPRHAAGESALQDALVQRDWQSAPLVAFQPGASTMSRRWPRGRFVAAATALVAHHPELRFVVTGSPAEQALCREVAAAIEAAVPVTGGSRAWASAGDLPLLAIPDLLRRAAVLVSGDTGPMHLAVTVETPVVALFAVSDPARSGPGYDPERHIVIRKWRTCDPCQSKNCPYAEPICMDNISVDEVVAAVDSVLRRKSA
ncbi:glycosyltransferase family 9 protein [Dechloromonas sp.]|uniref:glycosyltransferase family 9 protein n=1 Tax=Dechloromonas sp. TaxID=1917218 RepID=UPI00121A5A45|nr:glycosyltransferase family 9 protein [Dechloromonas sp.]MBU3698320.1 glycosyltransferase family 9 protein [Dechloromonas sp.]TEX47603.1 MAG: glycosyl transferase [Rhodocyclaceae bacterium]